MSQTLRVAVVMVWSGLVLAAGCAEPNKFIATDPARAQADAAPGGADAPAPKVDAPSTPGAPDAEVPFTCVADSPCTFASNLCLMGATACAGNEASCKATEKRHANGTVCGPNQVCLDGACAACSSGASCPLDGKPCRTGSVDCSSGQPRCTETGNALNGSSCGVGMVCQEGACTACTSGAACSPANPCHRGTLDCSNGVVTCVDAGDPAPAGAACGPDKVCSATGVCTACVSGASCDPAEACKLGKIDCTSGSPICVATGNASNGKACGNQQVCHAGTCAACSAGMPCTPENKCHTGTLSCANGTPQCVDTGAAVGNGTSCGTNQVCGNGTCVACTAQVSCASPDPCKLGITSCASGTSACQTAGNAPNGKDCGAGQVCNNGSCVACTPDTACEPAACKVGKTTCASGKSECTETGAAPNGQSCGTGKTCRNGSCVACNAGGDCDTNPGKACRRGQISCTTGTAVCIDGDAKNGGTSCGTNKICNAGSCIACGAVGQPCCGSLCPVGGAAAVCSNGTCTCNDGAACTTNPGNKCKKGKIACPSGSCVDGDNKPDDTKCGTGLFCKAGACQSCGLDYQTSCCPDKKCYPKDASDPLTCVDGECIHCGSMGQPCCEGTGCRAPDRCEPNNQSPPIPYCVPPN